MKITAATATPGTIYVTKEGHRVRFDGTSTKHRGLFTITDLLRNAPIAVPGTLALLPDEETASAIDPDTAILELAGRPRDALESRIPALSDDGLERLGMRDSRPWVTTAIMAEITRRTLPRAADPFVAPIPATAIQDAVMASDPTPGDDASEQVPEAGGRSAHYMRGRAAFATGMDALENPYGARDKAPFAEWIRGWIDMRDLAASEPGFVKATPASPVGDLMQQVIDHAHATGHPIDAVGVQVADALGLPPIEIHADEVYAAAIRGAPAEAPRRTRKTRPKPSPAPIAYPAIATAPAEAIDPPAGVSHAPVVVEAGEENSSPPLPSPVAPAPIATPAQPAGASTEAGSASSRAIVAAQSRSRVLAIDADQAPAAFPRTMNFRCRLCDDTTKIMQATGIEGPDGWCQRGDGPLLCPSCTVAWDMDNRQSIDVPIEPCADGAHDFARRDGVGADCGSVEAASDLSGEQRALVARLTGGVRENSRAMVGCQDPVALVAAIAAERTGQARPTILSRLEARLGAVTKGGVRPTRPRPVPVMAPALAVVAPAVEGSVDAERLADARGRLSRIGAAIAILDAAMPHLLAAERALDELHAAGVDYDVSVNLGRRGGA